ncbi:MAG: bifunctional oligoribonuclease/PAP phosphatase NrnA [Candidatus Pacebacteria bacterium]|nr:bifunctional oligoribonuclease/PAP phosphatase NrnA [Candidatus Paceibacterota bacterium]MDR3583686.1 bifunctional oligoribonuclease/PAP phosphatase NrnA [Candidatus Paceibacterota bacterium]
MTNFAKEFHTLNYAILNSENILLFAHSRPDSDTTGSVLALHEYIKNIGKNADVACLDPFPEYLLPLSQNHFEYPAHLDLAKYDLVIAADSVERGFHKIKDQFGEKPVIAILDHHPDITLTGDINIIDPAFSSVCEIVFNFFESQKIPLNRQMATYLMLGIMGDTGMFQHSNTTPRVMEIASQLMKLGAPLAKIVEMTFTNKKISTLKLWGKAFEKAKINPENGMIVSVLTQQELDECDAGTDDISQVAGILNTVPGTKFSLILSEREGGVIKGSLRSEEYKGADVSKIAALFGGGGHKLASGFEIKGKIVETEDGWKVE